ncbi:hypothetical protein [Streptantibioticus ferralitis]|uniref:Excreted virulence factor EspC (Type VII ESX diderm) n=1 Tax=Streptantibioticus ferralitis TaxID=236510 RepID=A0ABT5Z477_9ACTN|nr:hypothetical protein [Streptantibioticus ferralitis]MDF2258603.1 hypothetical protein [Streptantibioticus ferralitis]
MDIGVTPKPVTAAAAKFKSDRAAGAHKANLSDAESAGKAHSGWASGAANDACVSAWQSRLRELGKNVETAADAVTKAMDAYVSTDMSVSNQLHQQATWLEQS